MTKKVLPVQKAKALLSGNFREVHHFSIFSIMDVKNLLKLHSSKVLKPKKKCRNEKNME
jgi:hypothetical protein